MNLKSLIQSSPTALPYSDQDVLAPNLIIRSALFAATDIRDSSEFVKKERIYSQGSITIEFTGEKLNQNDLDVWLGIMRLISMGKADVIIIESERAFLTMLNRGISGKAAERLRSSINKLTSGMVIISNKENRQVYGGHLISEYWFDGEKKKWACRISPEMIALFSPGNWSRIDWAIRKSLTKYPISCWLHSYYSSHKNSTIPIGVETLQKMCGSKNANLSSFKQKLKIAADLLSKSCADNNRRFHWRLMGDNFYVTHSLGSHKKENQPNLPIGETQDIEEIQ